MARAFRVAAERGPGTSSFKKLRSGTKNDGTPGDRRESGVFCKLSLGGLHALKAWLQAVRLAKKERKKIHCYCRLDLDPTKR
ncbi:MAG TPA: hypothetical protein DDY77_05000 [Clostridiales bacterium]|nr:hypothetical protein [Clostridiales bacterium]